MNRLRGWWNWRKPRCGAPPPWRLVDAGPCILPRGHEGENRWPEPEGDMWHGDGNGYIWNDVLGRWQWMGPVVNLADEYPNPPQGDNETGDLRAYFTEWRDADPGR